MKRIVVNVSGVGCDEKARILEGGIRNLIQDSGVRSVTVQVEDTKELKIPSFVNNAYGKRRERIGE